LKILEILDIYCYVFCREEKKKNWEERKKPFEDSFSPSLSLAPKLKFCKLKSVRESFSRGT